MSVPDSLHEDPAATRPAAAEPAGATAEPWVERMQRARARHAAIARNLHTWANYKNWTEQVRNSWEEPQQPQPPKK